MIWRGGKVCLEVKEWKEEGRHDVKKYVGFGVQSDKEKKVRYLETSLPRMTTSLGTGKEGQVNGACVTMCTTTVSKLPFCGTLS